MYPIKIKIRNVQEEVKAQLSHESQVVMVYEEEYEEGDSIVFEFPKINQLYCIRIDDTLDEALVYITEPVFIYRIPFNEKKYSYNPKAFSGDKHYILCRFATSFEVSSYRNLAKNVIDQHEGGGCYPHAYANVETRGESVFAARNAIDGIIANHYHGLWPFESWGINRQDDAEITIEFGRPIDCDQVILYTRSDFPHDNWWIGGTLTFSDGSQEFIELTKTDEAQCFKIIKKGVTWVKLSDLIKADDPSPFPALTQIEVYGTEAI